MLFGKKTYEESPGIQPYTIIMVMTVGEYYVAVNFVSGRVTGGFSVLGARPEVCLCTRPMTRDWVLRRRQNNCASYNIACRVTLCAVTANKRYVCLLSRNKRFTDRKVNSNRTAVPTRISLSE